MNLKEHYNRLWNESLEKFRSGEFQYDPLINSESDTRYGLTLLARPSEEVAQNILDVLEKVQSVAPHQYYYPRSDLHMTVLSIISCYAGFSLHDVNLYRYQKLVQMIVDEISPFQIHFKGVTASPSCVLVQGFPADNQLKVLRDSLRRALRDSDLQHSVDKRYHRQTAHMTVVRFKKPLSVPEEFIETLANQRDVDFGSCEINQLELVGNDWYQQEEKVELVNQFSLRK